MNHILKISVLLLTALFFLAGCAQKEAQLMISRQPVKAVLPASGQVTKNSPQTNIPSQIQAEAGKVSFHAPVILGQDVDVNNLKEYSVGYKTINRDAVYNQLFQGVEIIQSRKGGSGAADSYEGSKGESLVVTDGGITYFSSNARPVLRAFHPDRRSDQYNTETYSASTDFDFSTRALALDQVMSQLGQFGIDLGNDYGYQCYSLDYNTMKSQEYAIDKDGNETKSIYKKDWNVGDNCYYFSIWQKCENLPVAYESHLDFRRGDAPIQVIYSKRGIEFLSTQMTLSLTPNSLPVRFASIDKVKGAVDSRFNSFDTNSTYLVDRMELINMTRESSGGSYVVSPAWLMDVALKDGNDSPYRFQIVIDAQSAEDITQ